MQLSYLIKRADAMAHVRRAKANGQGKPCQMPLCDVKVDNCKPHHLTLGILLNL